MDKQNRQRIEKGGETAVKKILLALLSFLCLTVFCGCKEKDENGNEVKANFSVGTFIVVEKSHQYMIIVHKETKVMYLYDNGSYCGGITVILDENGRPLLWEGDLQNG